MPHRINRYKIASCCHLLILVTLLLSAWLIDSNHFHAEAESIDDCEICLQLKNAKASTSLILPLSIAAVKSSPKQDQISSPLATITRNIAIRAPPFSIAH